MLHQLAVLRGVCQRTNIKEEVGNDIEDKVNRFIEPNHIAIVTQKNTNTRKKFKNARYFHKRIEY